MFRLHAKKNLYSTHLALYGIHKEFHHKIEKKILKNYFLLSIKKPFELKFMPNRLKLYLREMLCEYILNFQAK